jgi:twitching motility protein PilI
MSAVTIIDPAAILNEIDERCRLAAANLPQKLESSDALSTVCFRVGSNRLVAELGEVVEILTYPEMTVIPNTRSWVCGLANIRGKLLPVIDLNRYLAGTGTAVTFRTRVLVVEYHGIYSGLMVDEVFGLKHFPEEARIDAEYSDERFREYVSHSYRAGDHEWGLISLFTLVEAPQFLQTAV